MSSPAPKDDGPWGAQGGEPGPGWGPLLAWIALMAAAGACVWILLKLFPGRIDTADDVGGLLWNLALVGVLAAGVVVGRYNTLRALRHLGAWLVIAGVLALGYSFRSELRFATERVRAEFAPGYAVATSTPGEMVVSQDEGGHFLLYGKVNGVTVQFLVDTGASDIVLSPADAKRLGVDVDNLAFTGVAETANGMGRTASFTADSLVVGDLRLSDVRMEINQAPMSVSLLGMSFFRRLESFRVEGGRLYMRWRS